MSWHYLQGQEAESSEAIYWDGAQFVPSKSTTMLGGYCLRDSATGCCPDFPYGTISQPLTDTPGAVALTLSAGDSLARTSAQPEKGQASPELEAGFGLTWPASSAKFDRATSSWRIHPCLFPGDSMSCSVTLPRWGTMRDGALSGLTMPEHLTSGTGSGLWPTIRSTDGERGGRGDLIQAVRGNENSHYRMWQTPVADDAVDRTAGKMNSRGEPKLSVQVKLWPTPAARDSKGANSREHCEINGGGRKHMDQLANAVAHPDLKFPTPTSSMATTGDLEQARFSSLNRPEYASVNGGSLNPTWVEWLMGWPLGWTDLKPLAMDKFQAWQRSHGGSCHD